jgi:hypothetical protein
MVKLAQLEKLVKTGENQHLEFKKKADHPEKIVREMVAFANSGGGTLLIGVEDSGRISGIAFPDEEQFAMEAALSFHARPSIEYKLELIPVGSGKWVLMYHIPDGKEKPYFWLEKANSLHGLVFIRSGDQCLKASFEMYRILKSNGVYAALSMGELERSLFALLGSKEKISIKDFALHTGRGKKKISTLFIALVLQGVLEIIPGAGSDMFRLNHAFLPAKMD